MPDDLRKRGVQDDIRININEDWELRDWAKKFGISTEVLKKAVAEVGVMVKNVREWLIKNGHIVAS